LDTFTLMLKKLCFLFSLFFSIGCSQRFDKKDNTFYTYVREQIHTLDPIHAHDLFSHQMTAQVYEGLYHFHYLKRPIEVEPLLASAMPKISPDGTVYTIPLKKNIYFHDSPAFAKSKGRLFVANDFIYSIKRLAEPKNRSESFWVIENKIVGLDEWRKNGAQENLDIPGIKALDPHTLQIQLVKPNYQFLQNLTMAALYVVPREAVQFYGEEFGSHPVGTGPFVFESWIHGSQLRFAKNPRYNTETYPSEGTAEDKLNGNLKDAGLRLPLVDRVVVYEISEPQPQWLLFSKGDLDLLLPHKDYQDDFIQNGKLKESQQKKGLALELPPGLDVVYIGLNNSNPFLSQKKIRQAFSLAFDRQFSIDKFYNFLARPAHGPIPPGLDGYDENRRSAYSEYNIELAKKKLAEAGYPEGKGLPEFNYEMPSTHATARQTSEFFKQQLSLIGVKVKLVANTWPQFNDKIKKNKADIFDYSWNADYPDPENFFQLFYSKNISPGPNAASFVNKQFDLLYEKSLQFPPGDARTALYIQMEKLIMEECPWIFNVHRLRPVLKHSWLHNYKQEVMITDTMKYYRIDSALRAQMKESNL
jgi:oligopeptide transport system substrate-binding protein